MTPATGTHGTIRHPDVSEISDLAEGLLSPSRTAEIRRHLDDCTLCSDVRTSLEEIRGLLGTLPGPARMPSDIAGRIDAALAAEALLDATQPETPAAPEAPVRATGRAVSRETAPAGHPTGPTGPGRRRARRRIAVLGGLIGAGACALGLFLFGDFSGSPAHDSAARTEAPSSADQPSVSAAGGPDYTGQGLREGVDRLVALAPGTRNVPGEENSTLGADDTPGNVPGAVPGDKVAPPSLPACVREATGRAESPLGAERGTYRNTGVYLVVLPHPNDSSRIDAYVVDSGCEKAGSATPGKVLVKNTFPRS
ncbi:zf-HC2 domain-containing protein [Streptomyces sp. NPDC093224]|uniref:zf-HC2 domain-containing protein n=1 Tax=Streptomyces sp. NPDC093224 TaxID=3155198 RepID=UPI0034214D7E